MTDDEKIKVILSIIIDQKLMGRDPRKALREIEAVVLELEEDDGK